MNGTLLFFMALAWLVGFIHGWFGRGYSLKHKMYYDRVDDALEAPGNAWASNDRGTHPGERDKP